MLKRNQRYIAQIAVSGLPLLILTSSALGMLFNAGYFYSITGVSWYLVSIEDIAKSAIYGLLFFAVAAVISLLFLSTTPNFESQISKKFSPIFWLLAPIAVTLWYYFIFPENNSEFQTPFEGFELPAFMFLTAICFDVSFLFMIRERIYFGKSTYGRACIFVGVFLSLLSLSYFGGRIAFFSDISNLRQVELRMNSGQTLNGYWIADRSQFYLLLDPKECKFSVVQKSLVAAAIISPREAYFEFDKKGEAGILGVSELYHKVRLCVYQFRYEKGAVPR